MVVDGGNIREINSTTGNLEAPMSPLTIFLAKLLGLYCNHRCAGDDDAQGKRHRNHEGAHCEPAAPAVRRSVGPCRWPRHDNRPQHLVGGRFTSRHHRHRVAYGDPRCRTTRPVALSATTKLFEALRYEQLFYFYMGGTLILGLYLALAGFSA